MNIITLDVGGRVFKTLRENLCQYDCYFRAALSVQEQIDQAPVKELFIDRDPELFSIILNLMRNSHSNETLEGLVTSYDQPILKRLLIELDFYGLKEIKEFVMKYIKIDVVYKRFWSSRGNSSGFQNNHEVYRFDLQRTQQHYPTYLIKDLKLPSISDSWLPKSTSSDSREKFCSELLSNKNLESYFSSNAITVNKIEGAEYDKTFHCSVFLIPRK